MRRIRSGSVAALVCALFSCGLVGCVDGSRVDAPPAGDAGISDDVDTRSTDGAHACGIFPDTCPDSYNCYSSVEADEVVRRCLRYDSGKTAGDGCDEPSSCGDRLRCVDGTCRKLCSPEDPSAEGCPSKSVCVPVRSGEISLVWGVCEQKSDECTLWPNDDCPSEENCYALEQGNRCRPFDKTAEEGDPCDGSTECNRDQICVDADGAEETQSTCRWKCDQDHPCGSGSCKPIGGRNFGACFREGSGE